MKYKKYHQVSIYTSLNSKFCELTKVYFRNAGIDYQELEIQRNNVARLKMIEISGQEETPVVEFDGRVVIGYRPDVYDILIGENDKLKEKEEKDKKKAEQETDLF
jgi:glutaredoxin 3